MSTLVFQEHHCWYDWVRLTYTEASGTVNAAVRLQKKGEITPAGAHRLFKAASSNGPGDPAYPLDGRTTFDATFTTAGYSVRDASGFALVFECSSSGTPVGTVKLQGSNDAPRGNADTIDSGVDSWFDLLFVDESTGEASVEWDVTGAGNTILLTRGLVPARAAGPVTASADPGQNLSLGDTDAHAFLSAPSSIGLVMVSAPLTNTAPVFYGFASTVSAGATGKGIELQPGDRVLIPAANASAIYCVTATITQNVHAVAY